jgi:hypothetical protein
MSKELIVKEENFDLLADIELMQSAAKKLMQTKHYQAMGEAGIFAIIQKAKSLKINPIDALNGGLYFTQGKVGMSAEMMNTLIRIHGHSIQKDSRSNDQICILIGKRADNGDTWITSFSIDDAKRAGIYNEKTPWGKYPPNMCFNRALSNLARQLFPDVIKGCYEIDELKSFAEPVNYKQHMVEVELPELQKDEIEAFYKNFNGDEASTREYVKMCMEKKKCSESNVIINLKKDIEASHTTYARWKAKQKPVEIEPVESPSMESVSIFEGVK